MKLACSAVSVVSSVFTLKFGGKNSKVFQARLVLSVPFNVYFVDITTAGYPIESQYILRPLRAANISATRFIKLK
jgi:hypothetical protein